MVADTFIYLFADMTTIAPQPDAEELQELIMCECSLVSGKIDDGKVTSF